MAWLNLAIIAVVVAFVVVQVVRRKVSFHRAAISTGVGIAIAVGLFVLTAPR